MGHFDFGVQAMNQSEAAYLIAALVVPVTIYTELRAGKIRDWMTLPALACGLLLATFQPAGTTAAGLLAGVVLAASLAALPFVAKRPAAETGVLVALCCGLAGAILFGDPALKSHLWAAALGGGIFAIPYLISGMRRGVPVVGGGDVKLAAALGGLLGMQAILFIVYSSIWIGLGLSIVFVAVDRLKARRAAGEGAKPTPILSTRIPFGTAICGSVLLLMFTSRL